MDFSFTKEQENLRQEVRDFLETKVRDGEFQVKSNGWVESHSQKFSKDMSSRGWIGMTWPREYGGHDRSYIDRAVVMEE
ncbi:MAG: acyl-CoA dehydrogenase, partial [bacterium]